jgi:hypothetical protein
MTFNAGLTTAGRNLFVFPPGRSRYSGSTDFPTSPPRFIAWAAFLL